MENKMKDIEDLLIILDRVNTSLRLNFDCHEMNAYSIIKLRDLVLEKIGEQLNNARKD